MSSQLDKAMVVASAKDMTTTPTLRKLAIQSLWTTAFRYGINTIGGYILRGPSGHVHGGVVLYPAKAWFEKLSPSTRARVGSGK
jgi:hypothetical protein